MSTTEQVGLMALLTISHVVSPWAHVQNKRDWVTSGRSNRKNSLMAAKHSDFWQALTSVFHLQTLRRCWKRYPQSGWESHSRKPLMHVLSVRLTMEASKTHGNQIGWIKFLKDHCYGHFPQCTADIVKKHWNKKQAQGSIGNEMQFATSITHTGINESIIHSAIQRLMDVPWLQVDRSFKYRLPCITWSH